MPAAARKGDSETGTCDLGKGCCPHTRNGSNGTVSANVIIKHIVWEIPDHVTARIAVHFKLRGHLALSS